MHEHTTHYSRYSVPVYPMASGSPGLLSSGYSGGFLIFPYSTEVASQQAPVHIPWPALFQGACDVPDAGVACLPESEQKHGCKEEVMPTFSPTPTANSALLCPALPSAKQFIFLLPDTPAAQVQVTA